MLLLSLFVHNLPTETVVVSWYGRPFHGKTTASGIDFNMFEMTAAHCTLPLGSIVEGTNLENSITIRFRVTDTGPWEYDDQGYATYPLKPHPIRKFDLSMAAYYKLSDGDLASGIMPMEYRVIGRDITGLRWNLGG